MHVRLYHKLITYGNNANIGWISIVLLLYFYKVEKSLNSFSIALVIIPYINPGSLLQFPITPTKQHMNRKWQIISHLKSIYQLQLNNLLFISCLIKSNQKYRERFAASLTFKKHQCKLCVVISMHSLLIAFSYFSSTFWPFYQIFFIAFYQFHPVY